MRVIKCKKRRMVSLNYVIKFRKFWIAVFSIVFHRHCDTRESVRRVCRQLECFPMLKNQLNKLNNKVAGYIKRWTKVKLRKLVSSIDCS